MKPFSEYIIAPNKQVIDPSIDNKSNDPAYETKKYYEETYGWPRRALIRGTDQFLSGLAGAADATGKALQNIGIPAQGLSDWAGEKSSQLDTHAEMMSGTEPTEFSWNPLNVGNNLKWGTEKVIEQTPQIATTILPGGLAAKLFGKAAALLTVAGTTALQEGGSNYEDAKIETGKENPGSAAISGLISGGLEVMGGTSAMAIGKVLGDQKANLISKAFSRLSKAAREAKPPVESDLWQIKRILGEAMSNAKEETVVESLQEISSLSNELWNGGKPGSWVDIAKRVGESGATGGFVGGVFGGAGGVMSSRTSRVDEKLNNLNDQQAIQAGQNYAQEYEDNPNNANNKELLGRSVWNMQDRVNAPEDYKAMVRKKLTNFANETNKQKADQIYKEIKHILDLESKRLTEGKKAQQDAQEQPVQQPEQTPIQDINVSPAPTTPTVEATPQDQAVIDQSQEMTQGQQPEEQIQTPAQSPVDNLDFENPDVTPQEAEILKSAGLNQPEESGLEDYQKSFIENKVKKLGSIDAVKKEYNADDDVSNYAKQYAQELYGSQTPETIQQGVLNEEDQANYNVASNASVAGQTQGQEENQEGLLSNQSIEKVTEPSIVSAPIQTTEEQNAKEIASNITKKFGGTTTATVNGKEAKAEETVAPPAEAETPTIRNDRTVEEPTFKTEKGSVYQVKGNATQRNKSPHQGLEHEGDEGLKEQSVLTVYVEPEIAQEYGAAQSLSDKSFRIFVHPETKTIAHLSKPRADSDKYGMNKSTLTTYSENPEIGLSPIELWRPDTETFKQDKKGKYFKKYHAGNKITEIIQPEPTIKKNLKVEEKPVVAETATTKKQPAKKSINKPSKKEDRNITLRQWVARETNKTKVFIGTDWRNVPSGEIMDEIDAIRWNKGKTDKTINPKAIIEDLPVLTSFMLTKKSGENTISMNELFERAKLSFPELFLYADPQTNNYNEIQTKNIKRFVNLLRDSKNNSRTIEDIINPPLKESDLNKTLKEFSDGKVPSGEEALFRNDEAREDSRSYPPSHQEQSQADLEKEGYQPELVTESLSNAHQEVFDFFDNSNQEVKDITEPFRKKIGYLQIEETRDGFIVTHEGRQVLPPFKGDVFDSNVQAEREVLHLNKVYEDEAQGHLFENDDQGTLFKTKSNPSQDISSRAKSVYQETQDVKKAGFILPDGTMIEKSKTENHFEMARNIMPEHGGAALAVMLNSGVVRVNSEYHGVQIASKPSFKQIQSIISILNNFQKNSSSVIEMENLDAGIQDSITLPIHSNPDYVIQKIKDFYRRTGGIGSSLVQQFHENYATKDRASGRKLELVKRWVNDFKDKFKASIKVIQSIEDLPDGPREDAQRYFEQSGKPIAGVFFKDTGEVYVIADGVDSQFEAQTVILHEVMGHYGLREVFGEKLDKFLNTIYQNKDYQQEIDNLANTLGVDTLTATDEWFAEQVELGIVDKSLWNRFVVMVRRALRELGFNIQFTDRELRDTIRRAYNATKRQNTGAYARLKSTFDIPYLNQNNNRREKATAEYLEKQYFENKRDFFASLGDVEYPAFYSQMTNVVTQKLPNTGTGEQFKKMLQSWADKGEFKQEELDWSGIIESGLLEKDKVSKEEVLNFVDENRVKMEKVLLENNFMDKQMFMQENNITNDLEGHERFGEMIDSMYDTDPNFKSYVDDDLNPDG